MGNIIDVVIASPSCNIYLDVFLTYITIVRSSKFKQGLPEGHKLLVIW